MNALAALLKALFVKHWTLLALLEGSVFTAAFSAF